MLRFFVLTLLIPGTALAQGTLELAKEAHSRQEFSRAEALYKQAVLELPGSFDANFGLGMIYFDTRRWSEAIVQFLKSTEIDGTRAESFLARANAHLELNDSPSALGALMEGMAACKSLPEYWVMRAGLEALLGRKEEARKSLTEATKTGSGRADIAYQVGVTLLASLGSAREAEPHLAMAYSKDKANLAYAIAYTDALLANSRWSEAASVIAEVIQQNPTNETALGFAMRIAASAPTETEGLAFADRLTGKGLSRQDVLLVKSSLYHSREKLHEATDALDQALSLSPRHIEALVKRSSIRLETGDFDGSLSDARLAVEIAPEQASTQRALYYALIRNERKREAERVLRTWLALSRVDPVPYRILGANLRDRRAFIEAAAVYEALLALIPDDQVALDSAAACYISAGNAQRAVELLATGIERGVISADLLARLALAYRQQGDNASALRVLSEMRSQFSADTRGWTLAAAFLESAGRFNDAIEIYQSLDSAHPNLPDGLDGMARCLSVVGRHLEAARAWRKVGETFDAAIPALIAAGHEYVAAGKPEEADAMWRGVIQKRGEEVLVLGGYAQFLVRHNRTEEALSVYRKMISIAPTNAQPYLATAEILVDAKKKVEALDVLVAGAGYCFENSTFMQRLARAAADADMQHTFDSVIESLFNDQKYSRHTVSAWVDLKNRTGKLTDSLLVLEAAADRASNNADLWMGLSRAYALLKRDKEALEAMDKALEANPKDIELYRVYVSAAESAGDDLRSARGFEQLARLVPNEVGNWLKAAAYYDQIGQRSKAREIVIAASRLHPEDAEVIDAVRKYIG
ncbi:MAG: tetratricopeptide repeat protein [Fimbriimonadales bacterium]|nr:tetratricopeptide repeat protein [Fimbriimonadales bacterium]